MKWNPFCSQAASADSESILGSERATGGLGGVLAAVHGDGAVRVFAVPTATELCQLREAVEAATHESSWVSTDTTLESERTVKASPREHDSGNAAGTGIGSASSSSSSSGSGQHEASHDHAVTHPIGLFVTPRVVIPAGMGMGRELGGIPTCLDWSPRDPGMLLVGCADGQVALYDIEAEDTGVEVVMRGNGGGNTGSNPPVDAASFGLDPNVLAGMHPMSMLGSPGHQVVDLDAELEPVAASASASASAPASALTGSGPIASRLHRGSLERTASARAIFRVCLFPLNVYQIPFFAGEPFHQCAVRSVRFAPGEEESFAASHMSGDVIVWDQNDSEFFRSDTRAMVRGARGRTSGVSRPVGGSGHYPFRSSCRIAASRRRQIDRVQPNRFIRHVHALHFTALSCTRLYSIAVIP